MTKIIFSRDAYVASRTRTYMSYDKMSYASARRRAVHDADVYGNLSCGIYAVHRCWRVEVRCDD